MFGWIKSLFGIEKKVAESVTEALKVEQEVAQPVVEEPAPVAEKPKKAPAKKKAAPKKKATKKKSDSSKYEAMTKTELTIYAKNELGLDISRNRTKAYIIERILNHEKEK